MTRHRRSLFLAGFCSGLGIQKALGEKLPKYQLYEKLQGRVRFSLHLPTSPSPEVVITPQGKLRSFPLAACSCLPGKDDIYWRGLGEELLASDLLLFAGEDFASEKSIVSELGWDLSLANEINRRHVLASPRTIMWPLPRENRDRVVSYIAVLFLRAFQDHVDAHSGAAPGSQAGSPVPS